MATYVKIASNTVGAGGVASVTFSSIPSTYTDLILKFSARNAADSSQGFITFNGSATSYTGKRLYGSGSAASSDAGNTTNFNPSCVTASSYTASTFGNAEVYIPNYAGSNYKSVSIDAVTENNATTAYGGVFAGLWSNTAAITSITVTANGGNLAQYSTFTLYGVSNAQEINMADTKIVVNCETGEVEKIELTAAEIAQRDAEAAAYAEAEAAREAEATAKQAAKADLLAKLGITADEAKLLLG